jgi:hypothetical protein
MNLIEETYQILFLSSTIFIAASLVELVVKMAGRFIGKNDEIKYKPSSAQKITFLVSLSIFLSYLI